MGKVKTVGREKTRLFRKRVQPKQRSSGRGGGGSVSEGLRSDDELRGTGTKNEDYANSGEGKNAPFKSGGITGSGEFVADFKLSSGNPDMTLSELQKKIVINEMAAHWSAKNKLREVLIMKIGKEIDKDGDPSKWIQLLQELDKSTPPPELLLKSLEQ